MKEASSTNLNEPMSVKREEFEQFLQALTHEIRNRLNIIALEAADLAEQAGPQADSTRLQQQVQECSAFLKKVRAHLAPEGTEPGKMGVADFVKKLKERSV